VQQVVAVVEEIVQHPIQFIQDFLADLVVEHQTKMLRDLLVLVFPDKEMPGAQHLAVVAVT
jgi:hypothetical protein